MGTLSDMIREEGSSIASYYYSLPNEAGGIEYSYVIVNGKTYEAAKLLDGRFLWGATDSVLNNEKIVTVVGIDTDTKTKYSWTCALR